MSTPGSRAMAAGPTIMLLSVSLGIQSGAGGFFAILLSFTGVLVGASLVAVGIRMIDDPAPVVPAVFAAAGAPIAFLHRNIAVVGLVMASSAVVAVSGEAGPVLCFAMFALFLLGLSLINIGVLGE